MIGRYIDGECVWDCRINSEIRGSRVNEFAWRRCKMDGRQFSDSDTEGSVTYSCRVF